ncbi:SCP-like protein [Ancylostoma duodenale]|uniref:SCP-like protein n=1 Tax=Ancylostoma duodenale TaxID=51022 RepID=A0A0C2GEQ5_9BILA|nr:SCP-like protein [Ancylostoma duodenale]
MQLLSASSAVNVETLVISCDVTSVRKFGSQPENWDCLLENQAQKVVDKCSKDEKAPDGLGMVLTQVKLDTCNAMPLFKQTVDGWWNVVENATVNSNNPLLNSPDLQSFATEYDCNLEKSAYTVAQNCADSESKTSDVDEVWHVFNGNSLDATNAANKAITAWFDEIKTGFMKQATGSQNQFLPALKIPMFAKMIWESHKKIGCAIVKCTSATKVVCHYSPADARLGNTIYAMGPTCNRCGYLGAKCSTDTLSPGLCMK